MRIFMNCVAMVKRNWKVYFHLAVSGVVIVLSLMLFIYPAITICFVVMDSESTASAKKPARPDLTPIGPLFTLLW